MGNRRFEHALRAGCARLGDVNDLVRGGHVIPHEDVQAGGNPIYRIREIGDAAPVARHARTNRLIHDGDRAPRDGEIDRVRSLGHGVEPEHALLGRPVAQTVHGEDRPVSAHVGDGVGPIVVEAARHGRHDRRRDVEPIHVGLATVRVDLREHVLGREPDRTAVVRHDTDGGLEPVQLSCACSACDRSDGTAHLQPRK